MSDPNLMRPIDIESPATATTLREALSACGSDASNLCQRMMSKWFSIHLTPANADPRKEVLA